MVPFKAVNTRFRNFGGRRDGGRCEPRPGPDNGSWSEGMANKRSNAALVPRWGELPEQSCFQAGHGIDGQAVPSGRVRKSGDYPDPSAGRQFLFDERINPYACLLRDSGSLVEIEALLQPPGRGADVKYLPIGDMSINGWFDWNVASEIYIPAFPKYRRYSVRREGDSAIRIMKL